MEINGFSVRKSSSLLIEVDIDNIHKATVKELQELFSQKIQVPQIEWNINDVINKD